MKRTRGFTLMEVVLATSVAAMVAVGSTAVTIISLWSFQRTSAMSDVTTYASGAVQYMARDLEEAKQVTLITNDHVTINYPVKNANHTYNRAVLDTSNSVSYFRGDASHTPTSTGTYFYRQQSGQAVQQLCSGITNVDVETWSPGSVDVTIEVSGNDNTSCNMLHRAIYMRNY